MKKSLCLSVVLGFLVCTAPGQEKTPPPKKEPAEPQTVKVFRLQLCDPEEVVSVLDQLLEMPPPLGLTPLMPLPMLPLPPMPVVPGGNPLLGVEDIPWRLAADGRTGSVIVRGRARDLQLAAEVVSVLEQPPGKPLPKTKHIQAIVLKHAAPEEIANITGTLELTVRVVALSEVKMLIGAGSDEELRDWSAMVRELDGPERKIDGNNVRKLGLGGRGVGILR